MVKLMTSVNPASLLEEVALQKELVMDWVTVVTSSKFGSENMYFFNIERSDVPYDRYDRAQKVAVYEHQLEYMGINAEELLRGIAPKNSQSQNPKLSVEVLIGKKLKSKFIPSDIYFCTFDLEKTFGEDNSPDQYGVKLYTPPQKELKSYLYDTYPSFDFVPKISASSEAAEKIERLLRQGDAGVVLAYAGHY